MTRQTTLALKRILDIVVSAVLLVLLAPLLALLAILIKRDSPGPVFFHQRRPGLHGRPFTIYKLRTMMDNRDSQGNLLQDEQRLTRLGRALRRTSLDELPELFNVLKNDMSLVGPRPLRMRYLERYSPEQARRHEVKPGITGWAQVNGRNALTWEEKFRLDVWYVDNWNLRLDLKILWLTAVKVIKQEGVSAEGHVTMPEFKGSKQERIDG